MVSQQVKRLRALLGFTVHSLPQPYGHTFLQHMALRHPLRTVRGFWTYWRTSGAASIEPRALSDASEAAWLDRATSDGQWLLVATGFCQKPLRDANGAQGCPAGRFNHDCPYLADLDLGAPAGAQMHPACAGCAIRMLGYAALRAGASFAILTSAMDIAQDILLPSLDEQRFKHILFAICPYSLEPMTLALQICGLDGYIYSYEAGVCASFAQWLRADRGDKPERTTLSSASSTSLQYLLEAIAAGRAQSGLLQPTGYQQEGSIFRPV